MGHFVCIKRYGEVVPLGSNYLPSYAEGVRTGLLKVAPILIGQDPRQPKVIYALMDSYLKGHAYVKAPIDMACWDILGKVVIIFIFTDLCHLAYFLFERSRGFRFALY